MQSVRPPSHCKATNRFRRARCVPDWVRPGGNSRSLAVRRAKLPQVSVSAISIRLSHLDAVYFALGTLTTGSGNIFAKSEYSRTVQTIQLVFDLVLMGFAAGSSSAYLQTILNDQIVVENLVLYELKATGTP